MMTQQESVHTDMPPPPPLELTLVVATTRDMGIGAAGGLPWTGLRKEMAYFARVTKRGGRNAVIMGRKTWDSIPPRFRPLKGRLNVVISRSFASGLPADPVGGPDVAPVQAASLEMALAYLRSKVVRRTAGTETEVETETESSPSQIDRVFVIGGAQIYGAALGLAEARRVLLTRVLSDFSCDTFFPLALGSEPVPDGADTTTATKQAAAWTRRSLEEHSQWVGEEVAEGEQTENGTSYEFQMWERME